MNDNVTHLPTGPRPLGAIAQGVVAAVSRARSERLALMKAHAAAARFHEALAEALEAEDEIQDGSAHPYWTEKFKRELGNACVALRDMPKSWQEVLRAELPQGPEAA